MESLNGIIRIGHRVAVEGRAGEWMVLRVVCGISTLQQIEGVAPDGYVCFKGPQIGALVENLLLLDEQGESELQEREGGRSRLLL